MPGTTPNRNYPYSVPADTIDVPADMQALATKLDTDLGAWHAPIAAMYSNGQYGGGPSWVTLDAVGLAQITFPAPFTVPPVVIMQSADPGRPDYYVTQSILVGGFAFFAYQQSTNAVLASGSTYVQWFAYGPQPLAFPP